MTPDAYVEQLQKLAPPGFAWPRDEEALNTQVLAAWAVEYSRAEARLAQLLEEMDPRSVNELFAEMEEIYGLPDPCVLIEQTIQQRRAALVARVISRGGQSPSYFIALAESYGFPGATITDFGPTTCNDNCNEPLRNTDWWTVWQLNLIQETAVFVATCNSTCNDPLQSWGDQALECGINHFKPGHTKVQFLYGA